jgi:glycosyltransferase involved in cell wall biosynthesis
MRIAQVATYWPYVGGIESVVRGISENLVKIGFDVDVISPDICKKYQELEIINGVTVRRFKAGPLSFDLFLSNGSLGRFLLDECDQYDIVHVHGYPSFLALYAVKGKKKNKLVYTSHYSGMSTGFLSWMFQQLFHPFGTMIFSKVDKIICVSNWEKGVIKKRFNVPENRIEIIPNGVDIERIVAAEPWQVNKNVLLCVCRLEKYKNVQRVIEAMPYIPNEYILKIVGSGSYKDKLQLLANQLDLDDRVEVLSGLSNDQVYRWYKTCQAVIFPSTIETFGIVAIEGLAASKPVIINNKTGLAELAKMFSGIFAVDIDKLTPQEFGNCIFGILNMVENGITISNVDNYNWGALTEHLSKIYYSLLNEQSLGS